jgi:hypothetical protein
LTGVRNYDVVGVGPEPPVPAGLTLAVRSNPSRGRALFSVNLPQGGPASLKLFSVDGRLVRTLHDGLLPSGLTEIAWDGLTQRGTSAAAGVYFAKLAAADQVRVMRVVRIE